MNQQQNKMGTMPMPKLVANISLPLMISMLVQSLYNIVDGIFVAQISQGALTATSLAYPAQILMIAVSVGTGVGVNSLLSRKLGQRDFDAVNAAAANGLFLSVACSLVFVLLGLFVTPLFIGLFTNDAEILAMGASYLRICMLFCTGIFVATTAERLLQATGNTSLSMVAQVSGAVANIVLDPILIFGWFGLPAMGIRGAAVATVIGQWLAAVFALLFNKFKNKEIHFRFKGFRPSGKTVASIYKVGAPTILVQTSGSLMLVGMNAILTGYSAAVVAVFGVYYKLQNFVYMPVQGLSQGLIPIVGFNYGARNGRRVVSACKIACAVAVAIMALGTALFMAIPGPLLRMFDADAEMLSVGIPALRIISATFVLSALTILIGYALSGMGNGLVSMVGTMLRQLVVLLPAAWIFSSTLGLGGIWYAFWIAEFCAMAFSVICFLRAYRKTLKPLCLEETLAAAGSASGARAH